MYSIAKSVQIHILALVCKGWYDTEHRSALWKTVNFDFQRTLSSNILDYAGTREILLNECCFLTWRHIYAVLCH